MFEMKANYLKEKLPIFEVVKEYCGEFEEAGSYAKGDCPFCKDHSKGKQFTVSTTKNIFYCFLCHKGGDIITFTATINECSPYTALEILIEKYNIEFNASLIEIAKEMEFDQKYESYVFNEKTKCVLDQVGIMDAMEGLRGDLLLVDAPGLYRLRGECPLCDSEDSKKYPEFNHNTFFVFPQQNFFFCWSCGREGDLITFIARKQKIRFRDAVDFLIEKHGVIVGELVKKEDYCPNLINQPTDIINK